MTAGLDYLNAVRRVLEHLEKTQMDAVEKAAGLVADSVLNGGVVFCAGIGHANEQDFLNRAGGPAFLQPFSHTMTIRDPVPDCRKGRPRAEEVDLEIESTRLAARAGNLRVGDVLAVGSVSGRNKRPVELALSCRALGVKVIGFTSMAYTARVTSAHPSGHKLADVADVVVDNGAPYGDAAVPIPGYEPDLLPVSGVAMTAAGWMIWGRAMEVMAARGQPASVFMSVNRPDGPAFYEASKARYQRDGY